MRIVPFPLFPIILLILPAFLTACRGQRSEEALAQGYVALEQSRYDEALAAADRYLQDAPAGDGAARALYLRGRALEQRIKASGAEADDNLRRARAAYLQALRLGPDARLLAYIHTSLGNVSFWLRDYAPAEQHFKTAYPLLDDHALRGLILFRIALAQQHLGRPHDARATVSLLRRDHPDIKVPDLPAALSASPPRPSSATGHFVQVGAFTSASSADRLVTRLRSQGFPALRQLKPERNLHAVLVGPFRQRADAVAARSRLSGQFKDAMLVP